MAEERLLRFAEPSIYKKMIETFSSYQIHPHDVQATMKKDEKGFELFLRFPANKGSQIKTYLPSSQGKHFEEEMRKFFEKAAETCRSLLIKESYKMMKP